MSCTLKNIVMFLRAISDFILHLWDSRLQNKFKIEVKEALEDLQNLHFTNIKSSAL